MVHIITRHFPPAHGGLERWTLTLAELLAADGIRVAVYVRSSHATDKDYPGVAWGVTLHHLTEERDFLMAPLMNGGVSERILLKETARLDALLIRTLICEKLKRGGTHVLISNFTLFEGFIGHTLSVELGVPHIAILAGTDFSRGIRDSSDFETIARVLRGAKQIVTKSREQEVYIRTALGLENVRTIETSVDEEAMLYSWNYQFQGEIPIFADSGFSYKKGTHILMAAFHNLKEAGYPVTLTICGDIDTGQERFWTEAINDAIRKYGTQFSYLGYVCQQNVIARLHASAIYGSATIGEGCSKARATALSIGIPTVTTQCGELRFTEQGCPGIFLAAPGDTGAFTHQMRIACENTMNGTMPPVDKDHFRRRFARKAEAAAWRRTLDCFTT